jgi:MraZ protein
LFRGRFETTIDAKGRTSLPVRFREALTVSEDDRVVITTSLEPCLVAYPYSGWKEFESKLSALPSFDPDVTRLKRLYVASAVECSVDGHGRILISPTLREYAALARNAVWCGMTGYIELWDAKRWKTVFAEARQDLDGLGRALANLGL